MPDNYKGHAGSLNPLAWPAEHRGKRTLLIHGGGGAGNIPTLLEDVADKQIEALLGDYHPPLRGHGSG
ncbi:hypothetical protein ACVCNR_22375 (plasmid) [Aquamicrobium terrae]